MIEFFQNLDILSPIGIIILLSAGFIVGIINTFAGSGSAITYSLFMLLGLPAGAANGTLRLGVVMQTFAASFNYFKGNILDVKKGLLLGIPTVIGSLTGAQIAISLNKDVFEIIVGIAVILMLITVFLKPDKWIKGQADKVKPKPGYVQIIIFFLIGLYGGFIHIGVGIFLLAGLVLNAGYDLVKANALKVFIVLLYSPFALAIYIFNDQVFYIMGGIAAIGNLFGGIVASKFALKRGAGAIRIILIVVLSLFAAKLFGLFEFIGSKI
jgi:uncharacterized membrane protein YfcA